MECKFLSDGVLIRVISVAVLCLTAIEEGEMTVHTEFCGSFHRAAIDFHHAGTGNGPVLVLPTPGAVGCPGAGAGAGPFGWSLAQHVHGRGWLCVQS